MSSPGQKVAARIAALPVDDQEAAEAAALDAVDRLARIKEALARSEDGIAQGRVTPAEEVFSELRSKYAP